MNIEYRFPASEYGPYMNGLTKYLDDVEIDCERNHDHLYFKTTLEYVNEIRTCFGLSGSDTSIDTDTSRILGDRRSSKYIDFVEAYRLIKYQYSRYSQTKCSYTEAVYAPFLSEALRHLHPYSQEPLRILDAGCGPSRLSYEFSSLFPNSNIDLIDYSAINLFFAWRLISSGSDVCIPYRQFHHDWMNEEGDTGLLEIKAKANSNIKLIAADLSKEEAFQQAGLYDLVVSNHAINLLPDPKKVMEKLISQVKPNGYMMISDLLGWKENRPMNRRDFPDGATLYRFFEENINVKIIDYFSGGPYCEEVNAERMDIYKNHFIVLQKC